MAAVAVPTRQTDSDPATVTSEPKIRAVVRIPSAERLLAGWMYGEQVQQPSEPGFTSDRESQQWRDLWERLEVPPTGFFCTQTTVSATGAVVTVWDLDAVGGEVSRVEAARVPANRFHASRAAAAPRSHRPVWQIAAEITASVPDEEWEKLPTDLSKRVDHYLYGAPEDSE